MTCLMLNTVFKSACNIYINRFLKQEKRICNHLKSRCVYKIKYMCCHNGNLNIFHEADTTDFVQT